MSGAPWSFSMAVLTWHSAVALGPAILTYKNEIASIFILYDIYFNPRKFLPPWSFFSFDFTCPLSYYKTNTVFYVNSHIWISEDSSWVSLKSSQLNTLFSFTLWSPPYKDSGLSVSSFNYTTSTQYSIPVVVWSCLWKTRRSLPLF